MLLATSRPRRRSIPRTSSGLELPRGVDYRTIDGRRFRDLYEGFASEFGAGALTDAQKGLIRQAVMLQIEAELMQARRLQGEMLDPDVMIRLSGASRRALELVEKVGKRDEQPSELDQYLAEHYAADEADAEVDTAAAVAPEPISEP